MKGKYDPAEAQGKIFHFFACSCGSKTGIGADLVKNGARAFFGYSRVFKLVVRNQNEFCDCDMAIDKALIDGATAGEAYSRTMQTFDDTIQRLRSDAEYLAASYLEYNQEILVAPSTDPAYGDVNAKL